MNTNLLNIALGQYGVKEIAGEQDNPEVIKYFDAMGLNGSKLKDETAWCSAFMNWVAIQVGVDRSNALNARSWLKVGNRVYEPEIGDIVIFWRESKAGWKGHVAIFINETKDAIYVLGGNQSNQVNIKPYRKDRLLQYRRL